MATWGEMRAAIWDARQTIDTADLYVNQMAKIVCDRLRQVKGYQLRRLKRELKGFNAHTGEWKTG